MKITAGVLLIIAAIFNLFASLGYFAGGAITTGGAEYADSYMESVEQISSDDQESVEDVRDALQTGSAIGGGLMVFGIFLLVSVGVLIAGAVFLFKDTNAKFIQIAGGVAILAEVIGIYIFAFGIMNVIGLVGGVLALIAAKTVGKISEAPEEASA